eukprot:Gb_20417 [translate_table: standard]
MYTPPFLKCKWYKPLVEGRSCQGHRERVSILNFYTLGKGGRQVIGNHDLERWREWSEVTGVDLRSAMNHFNITIQSRGALEKDKISSERMGGDLVTMEPSVLKVDKEKSLVCPERERSLLGKRLIRVAIQIMKYLTLEVKAIKVGKGKAPLHQGLLKLLFDYEKEKKSAVVGPSKGGFSRLSGTPVSKSQLLLGPAPVSLAPKSDETVSNSKEDSVSQGDDTPLAGTKEGGGRKRKPPPQTLNASLAKCSRRSTRLQKKTADKAKIVDFVDSSEEDHTMSNVGKNTEGGCSFKMMGIDPSQKGLVKGPDGTQTLVEELKCHLKVLNGLGGSLSSTCECINLLTLEITNYLKEVVKNLKDLSATNEQ